MGRGPDTPPPPRACSGPPPSPDLSIQLSAVVTQVPGAVGVRVLSPGLMASRARGTRSTSGLPFPLRPVGRHASALHGVPLSADPTCVPLSGAPRHFSEVRPGGCVCPWAVLFVADLCSAGWMDHRLFIQSRGGGPSGFPFRATEKTFAFQSL